MKMTKAEALRVWESLPEAVKDPVRRGAAVLDQKRPRWLQKVDAATLDMKSCERCIVGQVEGRYENYDHLVGYPATCGFTTHDIVTVRFLDLDRAWSALLAMEQQK